MRRLWVSLALLAALAVLGHWNEGQIEALCADLTTLVEDSAAAADAGDWRQAEALSHEAETLWRQRTPTLHMVLRHDVINGVTSGLEEAHALARWQEGAEFAASCARVLHSLRALAESEHLSPGNLL